MLHVLLLSISLAAVTPPPPPPSLAPIATPTPGPDEVTESPSPSPSPSPSSTPTPSGPRLTVSPVNVDLNPAQQRTVLVSGGSPPLTATLDGKLVQVAVNDNATGATITATQQTGSDVLHLVDANGARADIPIRVAFNAGTIAATATLKSYRISGRRFLAGRASERPGRAIDASDAGGANHVRQPGAARPDAAADRRIDAV